MRATIAIIGGLVALLAIHAVQAFESTSTTYELHAGDIESITGDMSSTTYQYRSAAGQTAVATQSSSTQSVYGGILNWLYGYFTPRYDQIHFRWRNDDGTEATSTWAATEDATLSDFSQNTMKRLRLEVSNEGWTRGSAPQFKLEYAATSTCATGSFVAVPVSPTIEHWQMSTSTFVSDGAATTNVASGLTDANNTFVAGQVKTTGNTTGAITLTSKDFTEIEYGVKANSSSTSGATYCFRVTNNGTTTNMVFSQYAKAQITAGLPATGELISPVFDTTGSANGPAYNSLAWKGTLPVGTRVRFQLATSTSSSGPWNYYGSTNNDGTCTAGAWYDPVAADTPIELSCASAYHNNQQYFKYKIQLCSSSDCASQGITGPTVDDVIVSWSP